MYIRTFLAAALIMAYSPETWYAAMGMWVWVCSRWMTSRYGRPERVYNNIVKLLTKRASAHEYNHPSNIDTLNQSTYSTNLA